MNNFRRNRRKNVIKTNITHRKGKVVVILNITDFDEKIKLYWTIRRSTYDSRKTGTTTDILTQKTRRNTRDTPNITQQAQTKITPYISLRQGQTIRNNPIKTRL